MAKNWILYILFFFSFHFSSAQELEMILDLSGKWKFSIGNNLDWSKPTFQDSEWDKINVPGSWEEQGYYGYDGFAWYRTKFIVPSNAQNQNLYLELGYIDDVDEVFVNGVKIGSTGSFPPLYKTAYNAHRLYLIPKKILQLNGENGIAVNVFDEHLEGGILSGKICLYIEKNPMLLDIDLQDYWKFRTGDDKNWSKLSEFNSEWIDILVPGFWEDQGFRNYDGYAWYIIQITPDYKLVNENLVLVLGKIDDIDELYINGNFIASTGEFYDNQNKIHVFDEYNEYRGYYLPEGIFKPNVKNTIAVRVYDAKFNGGIYKGPIGIITQKNYIQYWRNKKEKK